MRNGSTRGGRQESVRGSGAPSGGLSKTTPGNCQFHQIVSFIVFLLDNFVYDNIILSLFSLRMTRITRSVTALARSLLNPKPPVQKKPLKLTKGQRGQVTKRIDAIGKLREAKILQNIAVNKLGVGQIPQVHPRKERIRKKTFSKKKENVKERNAKKASLGVENVKQVIYTV